MKPSQIKTDRSSAPALDVARSWAAAQALAQNAPPLDRGRRKAQQVHSSGQRARQRPGSGDEFWQYRPMDTGESASLVDWRRSGRSDALFVRLKEQHGAGILAVWADASASMTWRSQPGLLTKQDVALRLAGAAMLQAEAHGESVRLLPLTRSPAGRSARLFLNLASEPATYDPTGLSERCTGLIFGDFLDGLPDLPPASRGVLVHVIDPAEAEYPFEGAVLFTDADTQGGQAERLVENAQDAREAYLAAWDEHVRLLGTHARSCGWSYVSARTDAPLPPTLASIIIALGGA